MSKSLSFFVNFTARNASVPVHAYYPAHVGLRNIIQLYTSLIRFSNPGIILSQAPFHEVGIGVGSGSGDSGARHQLAFEAHDQKLSPPPIPPLRLSALDTNISMRIFVDDLSVECYWQDGRRVVQWGKSGKQGSDAGDVVSAFASGAGVVIERALAYEMNSLWVELQDLAPPPPPPPQYSTKT